MNLQLLEQVSWYEMRGIVKYTSYGILGILVSTCD